MSVNSVDSHGLDGFLGTYWFPWNLRIPLAILTSLETNELLRICIYIYTGSSESMDSSESMGSSESVGTSESMGSSEPMDFPGLHGFLGVCGFLAWDLLIPLEPMGGHGFYRFIGICGFPLDLSDSSESMGSSDSKESSESVGFR